MTFFCTRCWGEIPEAAVRCPHCGDDIAARQSGSDFVDKLLAALHHPEPTTPIRAAWILGRRREPRAVPALAGLAAASPDPFIAEAAVAALGQIGGDEARAAVRSACHHASPRVRRVAREALLQLDRTPTLPEGPPGNGVCLPADGKTA
jgi:HEAT repeat protein